jgi:hypothetical protein
MLEGLRPIALEVGLHTVALAPSDLAWLVEALAAGGFDEPARAGLAARLRIAAAAAEGGSTEPIVLAKLQREVLRAALDERLAEQAAPTESLKLLDTVLR